MANTNATPDRAGGSARPANRLAGETSPYLLQHAHNPVDWYPWGPEALERARVEDRPIFLSIGYSACHWCHVMERESFENPDIARIMNAHFVNVKVDREERPDLDQIYMDAVQAMTGRGGWPMSVFLTPELKPFFGGTYFPPTDARGMAGFTRVLLGVSKAWDERRDEIRESANAMTERLQAAVSLPRDESAPPLSHDLIDNAARDLLATFDPVNGGFGDAPKFPHPMDLRLLLRQARRTGDKQALDAVALTLDKMARGGIYDHLGGGFARYSTDERWLAPHFEKMLYDNALLASTYLEAHQTTGDPFYARVARATLDYVLGRMTDPLGGFYSTEDADSEGEEGKYYVWSLAEIVKLLGPERARTFAAVYDVSQTGNWERKNILNLPRPISKAAANLNRDVDDLEVELAESRALLLSAREKRVPPRKDEKVLVDWNGLMIATLAPAAWILKDPRYLDAAKRAAGFILDRLRAPDGKLLHVYKDDQSKLNAYLTDYACLIDGLTRLFEASGERRWIEAAVELAWIMIDEFRDPEHGDFNFTGASHEALIARRKDLFDNATPSGNGMAATALLRLAAITGVNDFDRIGREALEAARPVMERAPTSAGQSLIALDFALGPLRELAIVAGAKPDEFARVMEAAYAKFLPLAVVVPSPPDGHGGLAKLAPVLEDRPAVDGRTTLYYCEDRACRLPVSGVEAASKLLAGV